LQEKLRVSIKMGVSDGIGFESGESQLADTFYFCS
jgi:hypothetical protein